MLLLSACGEKGRDPQGPYKAYLILQDKFGTVHNFYLGGYHELVDCVQVIESEVKAYDIENSGRFYTNLEKDYGGFKTDALTVEHIIVGIECIKHTPNILNGGAH